jgi:uncharacterized protein YciI
VLFLITARDADDEASRQKRHEVLTAHRETLKKMIAAQTMVLGGSTLDKSGKRTGSVAILNMPDRATAEAWVRTHPYVVTGVWSDYSLEDFSATQSSIDWLPPETPRV